MAISTKDGDSNPGSCCKGLICGHVSKALPSPFEKHILLNYYDGALTGVLKCGACVTAYTYSILDWDNSRTRRIFALSVLPDGIFDEIVKVLSTATHSPTWPTWAPGRHEGESELSGRDRELQRLLSQAGPPIVVILADSTVGTISATRVPERELLPEIQQATDKEMGLPNSARDWFDYLGVRR